MGRRGVSQAESLGGKKYTLQLAWLTAGWLYRPVAGDEQLQLPSTTMLRTILRQSRPGIVSSARYSTATSTSSATPLPLPEEPPRISYLSLQTLYPFLLLSIITSLALNLSHNRNNTQAEQHTLRAQISVLETIVQRIRSREEHVALDAKGKGKGKGLVPLTEMEQEVIERELELVGLGRAKLLPATGAKKDDAGGTLIGGKGKEVASEVGTTWREVFLGKKGKEWEEDKDETDWEKGEPLFSTSFIVKELRLIELLLFVACSIQGRFRS